MDSDDDSNSESAKSLKRLSTIIGNSASKKPQVLPSIPKPEDDIDDDHHYNTTYCSVSMSKSVRRFFKPRAIS